MNTSKIIKGVVSNGRYTVTAPIVKEDYGLYLKIEGVELPETYQVDFSNSENSGTSVTMIGNADGVLIPSQFIGSGKDVFAFLYHVGEDFGRTVYKFRIPNKVRPDRTNEEPTPEEQSVIDQAISALNDAVDRAEDAEQAIEDMSVSATTLAEGSSAIVTKTEQDGVVHLEFGIPKGQTGDTPNITASKTGNITYIYADGVEIARINDGTNGIDGTSPTANVTKSGKVATITITDKNGTTSAQVEDGTDGTDGVSPTVTITPITGGHRITITDADGEHSADVMDGDDYTLTAQDKQDIAELVDVPVDDVQINGSSIVVNGMANVPTASASRLGVIKTSNANGIYVNSNGDLSISEASSANVKTGTNEYKPITPHIEHEATFFGLAKSAGDTTQSQSSNAVGNYTDTAKGKICNMLDVNRKMRLLKTIEVTEAVASVGFELDENGLPFAVDEVDIVAFIPKTSAPNSLSFAIEEVSTHRQSGKWVAQLSGITSESADTFIRMKIKRSAIRWETIATVAHGTYNGVYTGAIAVKDAITFMAFNGASWVRNNNPLYTTKLSLCINNDVLPVGSIFEFYAHDYQE